MESGDTRGQSQTEKCVVPIVFPDWKWEEKADSNSTLLLQKNEICGNMMVCCTRFAGFQPFYYIRKLRCEGIGWFAAHGLMVSNHSHTGATWDWGNMMVCCKCFAGLQAYEQIEKGGITWFAAHGLKAFSHLLHQQIEMWGNMLVCCTWFAGFLPFYYIRKLRCERIWWFAAHGLFAFNHSTTSANSDMQKYDGLLHMVCWLSTILLHQKI